eukprot:3028612-Pyramimonas_sp.AAC.1
MPNAPTRRRCFRCDLPDFPRSGSSPPAFSRIAVASGVGSSRECAATLRRWHRLTNFAETTVNSDGLACSDMQSTVRRTSAHRASMR